MDKELSSELEKQFCSLKNIRSAHVDFDENGEVLAIGIFSDGTRNPKDIKRDVEETFRQVAGYRVNYTKISIVEQQFDKEFLSGDKRIRFSTAYQKQKKNNITEGIVNLEYNGELISGTIESNIYEMELEYIISNATSQALMNILTDYTIRIDNVRDINMGKVDVIVVTLTMVHKHNGTGNVFVGSVVKTRDLLSSVAKATLNSLNRQMDQVM